MFVCLRFRLPHRCQISDRDAAHNNGAYILFVPNEMHKHSSTTNHYTFGWSSLLAQRFHCTSQIKCICLRKIRLGTLSECQDNHVCAIEK